MITGTVLIVDGDRDSLKSMGILLKKQIPAIQIDLTCNTEKAVMLAMDRVGREEYDLFVIDGQGDSINGIDLASVLSGINGYKDTPFIFISEKDDFKKKLEEEFPDVDIFMKPGEVQKNEFVDQVRKFLLLVSTLTKLETAIRGVTATTELLLSRERTYDRAFTS